MRTVNVDYSLFADLTVDERHLYKGITKKKIRVPVQRLVLILPVEERDPDLLHGGLAGQYSAPLDEVGHDGHVGVQTGGFSYPVVYDQVSDRYVWDSTAPRVTWNKVRGKFVYGGTGLHVAADVEGMMATG